MLINDTVSGTPDLFAFYLNREIGEEELLIENLTINRPALFEAEYNISGGTNLNPYYEYPNQSPAEIFEPYFSPNALPNLFGYNEDNNGVFSKDATFTIQNPHFSVLKAELSVNDFGIVGNWNPMMQQQLVCVLDFFCHNNPNCKCGAEVKEANSDEEEESGTALLYPNPVATDAILNLQCQECAIEKVMIFSSSGILVHQSENQAGITQLSLSELNLSRGLYMVKIESSGRAKTYKLIVQ